MQLLMVVPYRPCPTWGAGSRTYYLLRALAREHTVSVVALDDSATLGIDCGISFEDIADTVRLISPPWAFSKRLQQLGSVVLGRSYLLKSHAVREIQEELDALLLQDHYDLVIFESATIAGYRLPKCVKVIIDQHNIEYEILHRTYEHEKAWLRKWYNLLESRRLKPVEIGRCCKADVVLMTSERERFLLKKVLPKCVIEVVPNGVDVEKFCGTSSQLEVPRQIIFTGTMDYYPNIDAVLFFAQRCWPFIREQVPDATWQIVGKNPPPEIRRLAKLPGVTVTGSVPDVRTYLAMASVAIAPLLVGSGTRLKILEALAMQKAVVSTSVGCEGLSVEPGKHLVVADQPEVFAQAVVDLIGDSKMRMALGTAGRSLVEEEFSWERCGDRLLHILNEMNWRGSNIC